MRTPRILVVDDDFSVINLILAQLAMTGNAYEVSAIQFLGDLDATIDNLDGLDVLIVDVNLGEKDGFYVEEVLKKRFPQMHTVFISGMPKEICEDSLAGRCFLAKPFTAAQLVEKVDQFIKDPLFKSAPGASVESSSNRVHFTTSDSEDVGFRGLVSAFRLFDIIQLYILGHQSGRLLIRNPRLTGWIRMDKGHVIDAETGSLQGEPALFKILAEESGEFIFVEGGEPDRVTIQKRWSELSIDAARTFDEARDQPGA